MRAEAIWAGPGLRDDDEQHELRFSLGENTFFFRQSCHTVPALITEWVLTLMSSQEGRDGSL